MAELRWMRCVETGVVHAMTTEWVAKCKDLYLLYMVFSDEWTEEVNGKCEACVTEVEREKLRDQHNS